MWLDRALDKFLLLLSLVWMVLVKIVWCVHAVHLLFCSLSRIQLAATLVSIACAVRCQKLTSSSGQQFYKCSKREGGHDFFLWADSPTSASGTSNATTSSSSFHGGDSSQSYSRLAGHNCLCHVTSCDPQEYHNQLWIRTKLQMWI